MRRARDVLGLFLKNKREILEELTLPEPARSLWLATHEIIEDAFRRTGQCRLGGGTLLAARWKHRVSHDIDLTIEPAGTRPPRIENFLDEASRFRKRTRELGAGEPTARSPHHIQVPFSQSKLDIAVLEAQPRLGERRASVDGKPTVVLSTTQVLAGKLARSGDLLHRDAFDIRHAGQVDKQSLAEAVNRIHPRDIRKIIALWNRVGQRWAAWAPSQLRTVAPRHSFDGATLAAETATALGNSVYRHVRITTRGREGTFHAKTAANTAVNIPFTRRSLARTFAEHGISDYLMENSTGVEEDGILDDILKACRLGAGAQTVYEITRRDVPTPEETGDEGT